MARGWVCQECGIDYDTISPGDTVVAIRSYPRRFRAALALADDQDDPEAAIRRKPDAGTWSALVYTSHVADVFGFTADAADRILASENPSIADPGTDVDEEDVAANARNDVLRALDEAATRATSTLQRAKGDDWNRTGTFSWGERDLLMTARNAVHEGHHHLRDVERVLDAVRRRP